MSIIEQFDNSFRSRQSSYKMVTVLSLLDSYSKDVPPHIDQVVQKFKHFYTTRVNHDKLPEKADREMANITSLTDAQIKSSMMQNPIKYLNEFIVYEKENGVLKFNEETFSELSNEETDKQLRRVAYKHLYEYYRDLNFTQITLLDLMDGLSLEFAVSAKDIASLSHQNQIKGIHPIDKDGYKAVIILCTIGGEFYQNAWLNEEKDLLKYYAEGRKSNGKRSFNLEMRSNKSIIDSKVEGYPIHVFIREQRDSLFHYAGEFSYQRHVEEDDGGVYFELKRKASKGGGRVSIPDVPREKILVSIREFDDRLRNTTEWQGWQERASQKYAIKYEENLYPPKQIISMATGLSKDLFSGGEQSNSYLEKRGFEIITLKESDPVDTPAPVAVVNHIIDYIANKGFVYSPEFVKNIFLSLKTKPFIILSGISGTGKSKVGELFAEALGANAENGRFHLIAVRPDWNDSTDLLGYRNLQGEFVEGHLTKVIRKALSDPDNPYFVCLDEMNLARVEYYFSDFLSIIESRKLEGGKLKSFPIVVNGYEEPLYFPENFYLIGTVNMDETTHSFSRKVLDRANTIEFSEIALNQYPQVKHNHIEAILAKNEFLKSKYIKLQDCYFGNEPYIHSKVELLEKINNILKEEGFHVGYRVRDEFCFYLLYNKEHRLLPEKVAEDFQIMQKILPRIQGSSLNIEKLLNKLKEFCGDQYPRSKRKIEFMLRRFENDGFTSFWA